MYQFTVYVLQITLIACSILSITTSTKLRFDNYRVYSFAVDTENQLEHLQKLEATPNGWEFLEYPILGRESELLVPPHKVAEAHELFKSLQLKYRLKTRNIQQLIDAEQRANTSDEFGWNRYYRIKDIYNWLDTLLKKYPNVLKNFEIGKSYENRTLRAIKLSHKPGNPTIFVESLIHAREWITVATSTYLLNELLTSDEADIVNLAKNYDWVFVPILNIDGYAYSYEHNRMWRKTRQPHSECIGADANRNFKFHFGSPGSSSVPCSQTYSGPEPFSEPETKALANFVSTFNNIKVYLALHSYGQYLLHPYGHTTDHSFNHNDLTYIASKAAEAVSRRFGTKYTFGSTSHVLYKASGSSMDWAYGVRNVSLSYTFEFRDRGQHGFILPSQQIVPNSLEFIDGLKVLIKEAQHLNYL